MACLPPLPRTAGPKRSTARLPAGRAATGHDSDGDEDEDFDYSSENYDYDED